MSAGQRDCVEKGIQDLREAAVLATAGVLFLCRALVLLRLRSGCCEPFCGKDQPKQVAAGLPRLCGADTAPPPGCRRVFGGGCRSDPRVIAQPRGALSPPILGISFSGCFSSSGSLRLSEGCSRGSHRPEAVSSWKRTGTGPPPETEHDPGVASATAECFAGALTHPVSSGGSEQERQTGQTVESLSLRGRERERIELHLGVNEEPAERLCVRLKRQVTKEALRRGAAGAPYCRRAIWGQEGQGQPGACQS
ncbi:uncharacterized protein LOC124418396 [Gallus gallus]|uniref:uncharacterized protein LOC124418396 n=1 Tax=Gallus gallus TaxID=9031 RepID=UPI001F015118|nr:uncharacterized protein LOC124418396 [Gallus gallus]